MDDLSKLIPIGRGEASERQSPHPDPESDWMPREPEVPWRLAVVEAWFTRARQAGIDTIAERRRARLAEERERSARLAKSDSSS